MANSMNNRKVYEEDLEGDSDSEDEVIGDANADSSEDEPQQRPEGEGALGDDSSEDSDADSNADEEMDVDEDALQSELQTVNDQLATQPYSYDLYLDKIRILKSMGDLDKLRGVREKMSQLYPLSPTIWLDWIKDEQKMISTDEEKDFVISLMDRAVKDYASVEVWLEYVNFCLGRMHETNGVQRCREVFERAIANCGLHVSMGSLLWETYRDFEAAVLGTKTLEDEQAEQEKKYISLCKRQLSIPLLDMKNSYEQITSKIDVDENTEEAFKKAAARLKALQNWEAKLIQTADDTQKVQVYKDYIEDEKKVKSNPARIQCLYERAVTDFPLDLTIWTDYIDYLSKNLKICDLVLEVAERASRNCPWVITVWTKYMWAIETFLLDQDQMFEKVKTVFEKAIIYCGTAEQAGTLWLKYLEFLRRRIDYDSPDEKMLVILRKTFTAAEQHLLQLVQEPNDYISQILQFHARFEATLAKSMTEEVRNKWKDIFRRGYGQSYRVWAQYISQEQKHGADQKKIRGELSKAMGQVQDDPQSIADLWLNFERDCGNLITMSNAEAKISKDLEKVASVGSEMSNRYNYNEYNQGRDYSNDTKGRKRKVEDSEKSYVSPKKGKFMNQRNQTIDDVDGKNSQSEFKMPAIPPATKGKWEAEGGKPVQPGKAKPAAEAPAPVKHDSSKDPRTVFVSNLDYKSDEESVKQLFASCGPVEEVRLVRDFKGNSKGFGYVFFENEASVKDALEKDRQPLNNRPVFISRCDPDKATRQTQFKYARSLEKNKIFVKGLPFSYTAEQTRALFEAFGKVKDCRLVTLRNGHSKGLAYIDFEDEKSASAAILKTDGMTIQDKTISVAISNPPSKSKPPMHFGSTTKADPSERRSRNAFVPRALQVHPAASSAPKPQPSTTVDPSSSANKPAPKTNDEFRKLFMKQ